MENIAWGRGNLITLISVALDQRVSENFSVVLILGDVGCWQLLTMNLASIDAGVSFSHLESPTSFGRRYTQSPTHQEKCLVFNSHGNSHECGLQTSDAEMGPKKGLRFIKLIPNTPQHGCGTVEG